MAKIMLDYLGLIVAAATFAVTLATYVRTFHLRGPNKRAEPNVESETKAIPAKDEAGSHARPDDGSSA